MFLRWKVILRLSAVLTGVICQLPILMCIADDTKWLFFRIVPPPSAGEQYKTKSGSCQK